MNLVLRVASLVANTFILAIRGYAPESAEAEVTKDEETK